jgi:hypothetical protein
LGFKRGSFRKGSIGYHAVHIHRDLSEKVRFVTTIFADFSNLVGLHLRLSLYPSIFRIARNHRFFAEYGHIAWIYPKRFDLLPRFWPESRVERRMGIYPSRHRKAENHRFFAESEKWAIVPLEPA